MNLRERGLYWKARLLQHNPAEPSAAAAIAEILDAWLAELSSASPSGKANRIPSSEMWGVTKDLLELGWLQNRARIKPRGYAGDYELFARICDETLSDDPWGRVFDQYFQSQAAPQAVRERTRYVTQAIVELMQHSTDVQRIVSIGSGPARDLRSACRQLSPTQHQRLDVVLVDIDPDALDYAAASLSEYLSPHQLHLERHNLFRLPKLPAVQQQVENASLIACTGLFDYLDPPDVVSMLRFFHANLRQRGRGIVFHMSPANPTRAYMEWIANWYLNYRSAEELNQLAKVAGLPATMNTVALVAGLAVGIDWVKCD